MERKEYFVLDYLHKIEDVLEHLEYCLFDKVGSTKTIKPTILFKEFALIPEKIFQYGFDLKFITEDEFRKIIMLLKERDALIHNIKRILIKNKAEKLDKQLNELKQMKLYKEQEENMKRDLKIIRKKRRWKRK